MESSPFSISGWLNFSLLLNLILLLIVAILIRKKPKSVSRIGNKFGQRLFRLHPELNPRDLRLAEWVAQGYSNDRIADELFISVEGVKKSKYRLKQKLKLSKEASLQDYLRSIVLDLSPE